MANLGGFTVYHSEVNGNRRKDKLTKKLFVLLSTTIALFPLQLCTEIHIKSAAFSFVMSGNVIFFPNNQLLSNIRATSTKHSVSIELDDPSTFSSKMKHIQSYLKWREKMRRKSFYYGQLFLCSVHFFPLCYPSEFCFCSLKKLFVVQTWYLAQSSFSSGTSFWWLFCDLKIKVILCKKFLLSKSPWSTEDSTEAI